jgi:hypothetical protein
MSAASYTALHNIIVITLTESYHRPALLRTLHHTASVARPLTPNDFAVYKDDYEGMRDLLYSIERKAEDNHHLQGTSTLRREFEEELRRFEWQGKPPDVKSWMFNTEVVATKGKPWDFDFTPGRPAIKVYAHQSTFVVHHPTHA